jgi:hypothetical protein
MDFIILPQIWRYVYWWKTIRHVSKEETNFFWLSEKKKKMKENISFDCEYKKVDIPLGWESKKGDNSYFFLYFYAISLLHLLIESIN